jgi:hypothetical protein
LEHSIFFHVGKFIIPTDFHSIIFQGLVETTNQDLASGDILGIYHDISTILWDIFMGI